MGLPVPNLNDVLRTIERLRTAVEKLRRRESGSIEAPAGEFPHRVRLRNFRAPDEIAVVASGWWDDGRTRALVVRTKLEWDGEHHVLTLEPFGSGGEPIEGLATVSICWIAMA